MVQVGCTSNYARTALWKETEEFGANEILRLPIIRNRPRKQALRDASCPWWFAILFFFDRTIGRASIPASVLNHIESVPLRPH
jgi:hypothetical protein